MPITCFGIYSRADEQQKPRACPPKAFTVPGLFQSTKKQDKKKDDEDLPSPTPLAVLYDELVDVGYAE